ncbi:MAG: chemotaxis protein CheW, partial [Angelakisella sp.]
MDEHRTLGVSSIARMESLSEMDGKYLTFFTENQLFGVPISDVVQIVGMQEITQVPEFPVYA